MPPKEGKPSAGSEKKARRQAHPQPPVDIERAPARPSPTDRLESAKDKHIALLDQERLRLLEKVERLQSLVDQLAPENARLREAHGNAVVNNIVATIFVAVGGGSISFATFVEGSGLGRGCPPRGWRRDPDPRDPPRTFGEAGCAELIGHPGRVRLALRADGFAAREGRARSIGRGRSLS
jgi:hypothetical protein